MKKTIRQIAKVTLSLIACLSFILMCGETPDGGIYLPWNLGWLASLAVCTKLLDKMGVFEAENQREK